MTKVIAERTPEGWKANGRIWNPVVSIPEGKVGEYEIEHETKPPGHVMQTASKRAAIIGRQEILDVEFPEETTWHRLVYSGGVWMTDHPCEQVQMEREIRDLHGRVLVGGLGLGLAPAMLSALPDVESVTVVEKSDEVCQLVTASLPIEGAPIRVEHADVFDFLRELDHGEEHFDCAFFDIWQSDGLGTFFDVVCPLYELSKGKFSRVTMWNENVMRGQLWFAMHGALALGGLEGKEREKMGNPPTYAELCEPFEPGHVNARHWNWKVPFFRALEAGHFTRDEAEKKLADYCGLVGLPMWQARWHYHVTGSLEGFEQEVVL